MSSPAEVRSVKAGQPARKLSRVVTVRKVASDGGIDETGENEQVVLERVLGITASTNASLACNPVTGVVAYPAGSTVVLFNPHNNKQEFIHNSSKKTITCVAFSTDGKCLAIGESGHQPSVRAWSVEDATYPQISDMANGHKHGIACIAFSPDLKHLVSVGFQHDMLINMWSLKDGTIVGCNKVSTKVYGIYFSESADYFVTCGVRHVKFWYFDAADSKPKDSKDKNQKAAATPINGRSGLLGKSRNSAFCDVVCGVGKTADKTYCVTNDGKLCSFGSTRFLEESVDLKVSRALCIAIGSQYICCGCTNGIGRICDPQNLEIITTLPRPHFLGINVADATYSGYFDDHIGTGVYPDVAALTLDSTSLRLTCVYNDHSLYVWDISDLSNIAVISSFLYHSASVWSVMVYPEVLSDNNDAVLPPGSFLTCSGDGTVRIWNVDEDVDISSRENICSKELLRVLYVDDCYTNLKDTENALTGKNVRQVKNENDRTGIKSLAVSADGQVLAIGDRAGNVRVYAMGQLKEMFKIEAHESEVLCVEFAPLESNCNLLATAGRDRLIHIFDANQDFALIQTLDDHSSSITSIKFSVHSNGDLQLLSCGADRTMYFRVAQRNPELQFVRVTHFVSKTRLHDMAVDRTRNLTATACQDRMIRVYDSSNGRQVKYFKGSISDDGMLLKVALDRSGFYAATSCSDKTLSFYDLDTGEFSASIMGHSEQVTDIAFTNDCKKLITVSGDGCIFLWALPSNFTQNIIDRLADTGLPLPRKSQITAANRYSSSPMRTIAMPRTPGSPQINGVTAEDQNKQETTLLRKETFTVAADAKEASIIPPLEISEEGTYENTIIRKDTFIVASHGKEDGNTSTQLENENNIIRKETFKVPTNRQDRPRHLPLNDEDPDRRKALRGRANTAPVVTVTETNHSRTANDECAIQDNSRKVDPGNVRPRKLSNGKSKPVREEDNASQSQQITNTERLAPGESQSEADYRFSVGQLPSWARNRIDSIDEGAVKSTPKSSQSPVTSPTQPAGRWAERVSSTTTSISDSKASVASAASNKEKKIEPGALSEPALGTTKKLKKKSSPGKSPKHQKCALL